MTTDSLLESRVYEISKDVHKMSGALTEMQKTQDRMLDQHEQVIRLMERHETTNEKLVRAIEDINGLGDKVDHLCKWRTEVEAKRSYFEWWLTNWKSVAVVLLLLVAAAALIMPNLGGLLNGGD